MMHSCVYYAFMCLYCMYDVFMIHAYVYDAHYAMFAHYEACFNDYFSIMYYDAFYF